MTSEAIQNELLRFVRKALGPDVAPETNIFEAGATSLFSMELVMFIEGTFSIELDDSDLELANFSSVAAMTQLAVGKTAPR